MELSFKVGGTSYSARANVFHNVSIGINPETPSLSSTSSTSQAQQQQQQQQQPQCFGLPFAAAAPFKIGNFIASVDEGASINCGVVSSLCPHSNGTHTECVGHALPGHVTLADINPPITPLMPALLLTVTPQRLRVSTSTSTATTSSLEVVEHASTSQDVKGIYTDADEEESKEYTPAEDGDLAITRSALEAAFASLVSSHHAPSTGDDNNDVISSLHAFLQGGALLIRTLPNDDSKKSRNWSNTNPPFLTGLAMSWILSRGIEHILTDLPSADKENDQGLLIAHRTFWGLPMKKKVQTKKTEEGDSITAAAASAEEEAEGTNTLSVSSPQQICRRTITELLFVPDVVADGKYLLDLQVAPLAMDAAPSRPLLFPLLTA